MARSAKNIFAQYADRRGGIKRNQDGRFLSPGEKSGSQRNRVRVELDERRTVVFDKESGRANLYIRGASSGQLAVNKQQSQADFKNDVFNSESDYERSVASVIARIKSGEIRPIEPDTE